MPRSLRSATNESNPNKVADCLREVKAGDALTLLPGFITGVVTAHVMALPTSAKAKSIMAAFATAGGSTGAKTPVAGVPAAGQVSINALGDILFAVADAVTAAEVTYTPQEGEVFTETVDVAASAALFSSGRKGVQLLSAIVDVGIILGAKAVLARAAVPAAGQASLSTLGTGVTFNAADVVVGRTTLTWLVTPGSGGTTSVRIRLFGDTLI